MTFGVGLPRLEIKISKENKRRERGERLGKEVAAYQRWIWVASCRCQSLNIEDGRKKGENE